MISSNAIKIKVYRPGWPHDAIDAEIAIVQPDEVGECYDIQVLDDRYLHYIARVIGEKFWKKSSKQEIGGYGV